MTWVNLREPRESRATPAPTVTIESHFMLILLRDAVSVSLGVLVVALMVLPQLNGIVAPALLPMASIFALTCALPLAIGLRLADKTGVGVALFAGGLLGVVPGLLGIGASFMSIPFMMLVGAGAALIAWGVNKLQSWPLTYLSRRARPLASLVLTLAVALLAVGGVTHMLARIAGPKDMSCHNIARHGGRSFPVIMSAKLRLEPRDWPRLNKVLAEIAAAEGWSLRDYSEAKNFGVSLCQEVGTQVWLVQRTWITPPETSLTINLTAPQGGQQWRWPADKLLHRLSSGWPNALSFEPWSQVQSLPPSPSQSSAVATPGARP